MHREHDDGDAGDVEHGVSGVHIFRRGRRGVLITRLFNNY